MAPPVMSNPFPGLRHFETNEEYLFFGREGQSEEILRRLGQNRFVAVVGTSGSGKSYLVRAGLFPISMANSFPGPVRIGAWPCFGRASIPSAIWRER